MLIFGERWKRKLNMDEFSNTEIRKYAHRNPGKSVIVQDENTGEMSYLVRHFRDRLKTP